MTKRRWIWGSVALAIAILACGGAVAGDFYFEATMQTSGMQNMPAMTMVQKVWMSKGKMKMDITGGPMPMKVLIRTDLGKMYTIMDMQRSYMEMPLGQMGAMAAGMAQQMQFNVQKTGKTRTIGEWNCQEYVITATGSMPMKVVSWVTTDVEVDEKMMEDMQKAMGNNPMMKALAEKTKEIKGFPIEQTSEITMMGQQIKSKMTVTKIQEGSVPASMFELPAGYQKMQMPAMPPQGGGVQR